MDLPTVDSARASQADNSSISGYPGFMPARDHSRAIWILACSATLAVCIFIVFRAFWLSRGNLILSDPVDGRFSIAILEHWNRVFHGQARFTSPNFFFPEKGVLGYSEAFFLLGIPFSVLRSLGIDLYLAFEITLILLTAVGFFSMLLLLRTVVGFRRPTSLLGAYLFTSFNIYYIHIVHPQLVSVVFVPLILLLAANSWEYRTINRTRMRIYVCGASVMLALTLFTSFYVGWFAAVFCAVTIVCYFGCVTLTGRTKEFFTNVIRNIKLETWTISLALTAFGVALVPFCVTYLPALRHTGTRRFTDTLYYMPHALGALDVGRNNLVWGELAGKIENWTMPGGLHEHPAGWPLLTVAVFLCSGAYSAVMIVAQKHNYTEGEVHQRWLIVAITGACLVLWLAGTRFGNEAPVWALLWKIVPGANAIRVPQRLNLVLSVGIIVVCLFGLERVAGKSREQQSWRCLIVVILATGLVVEQTNSMPTHLIFRSNELTRAARLEPPPPSCSEFYRSGGNDDRAARMVSQVDAMLIAERFDIPTINGYSGWFPAGWDLLSGNRVQMAEAAREWAEEHNLPQFCAFDADSNVWLRIDAREPRGLGEALPNAVQDSGFESDDLAPWLTFQKVHVRPTDIKAHSGNRSLEESGGIGSAYQDVTFVDPGLSYSLSAWVSGSPGTIGQLAIFDLGTGEVCYSAARSQVASWQFIVDSCRVRGNRGIRIHLFKNTDGGTLYWDDVQLHVSH